MSEAATPWLKHLETLRPHLSGQDHRGRRGSLRWLEAVLAERGGRAGTVRNILYKDLGSPDEKLRLFEVLVGLFQEVGLEPPPFPGELAQEAARRALGRDKRRLFRRFVRGVEAGERIQMVVVGGPATGKGVLLGAIERTLPSSLRVNLGGEMAPQLYLIGERLGIREGLEALLAQLSPTQPYALQSALQDEIKELLKEAIEREGVPLLLRAEAEGQLGGLPLRVGGERANLTLWLEPLLRRLSVPYIAALSEPPASLSYSPLSAPSRAEARRYVRDRLPDLPPERVEALVNQAGRNFGELSRLVLLEAAQRQVQPSSDLRQDPALRPILEALAVFSLESDPAVPVPLLEAALGRSLSTLSQAERALLQPASDGSGRGQGEALVRPVLRTLLPEVQGAEAQRLHALALEHYRQRDLFRALHHAWGAGALEVLLELLAADPSRLSLLPGLWAGSQDWPAEQREALATVLVRYRAVLGQYAHPEALEALELLSGSKNPATRAWARVKAAEAKVDAADYPAAQALLPDLSTLSGEVLAEGLLVHAAIARWQGDYALAEDDVQRALALPIPPFLADRVRLWQGLVAKDAGRFKEALEALEQVQHDPLLSSRARYQAGDLLMRLGRGEEAVERMKSALAGLTPTASEEAARVRARLGTALRRIGRYEEAAQHLYRAIAEAPDAFTRARAQSEAGVLEAARHHPWEAISLTAEAERYLRGARERRSEALYRYRRTIFRLAAAYWVWETGDPYRPPFRGGKPAPQAQRLLEGLWKELQQESPKGDRYTGLMLDTALMLSLLLEPTAAQALMHPFLRLENPYLRDQARLAYADAMGREGRWGEVLAQLVQLSGLETDPGTQIWKSALEAQALLGLKQEEAAWERLQNLGHLPEPFRVQLGRLLGRVWPPKLLKERLGAFQPLEASEALALWLLNPLTPVAEGR